LLTNLGSPTSWSWNFGDAATSNQQNPAHTYSSAGTYNVTLTVTTSAGCSNSITKSVTVNPNPAADFGAVTVCLGIATQFTDLSAGNPVSWSWDLGDGNTSNLQNLDHTYTFAGTYNVNLIVTSINGCEDTVEQPVAVNPMPIADFGYLVLGLTVLFSDSSRDATSWFWDFGDGQNINIPDPVHTYQNPDAYLVSLSAGNNCGSDLTFRQVSVISTGLSEAALNQSVQIYPNPANKDLIIKISLNKSQFVEIKFYDIRGSLIKEMASEVLSKKLHELDISSWIPGIYYIKIQTDKWVITKKVAVIRQ